jgi:hypothetical protein
MPQRASILRTTGERKGPKVWYDAADMNVCLQGGISMRFDHSSGQYIDREDARIYFETTGSFR